MHLFNSKYIFLSAPYFHLDFILLILPSLSFLSAFLYKTRNKQTQVSLSDNFLPQRGYMKSPLICRRKPFPPSQQQIHCKLSSKNPLHFYCKQNLISKLIWTMTLGLTSLWEETRGIISDCHSLRTATMTHDIKCNSSHIFILMKTRGLLSQMQMLCWQHSGEPISLSKTLLPLQFLLFLSYFIDYTIQPWHFVIVYSSLIISYKISFFCSFSRQLREPSALQGF